MKQLKDIQADMWSRRGGRHADMYWNVSQKRGKQFLEYFADTDIESVFEVGCNSGRNLYYISENMSLQKVGGLEISPHAVQEAQRHVPSAVIYEGNLHDLDVEEKYDVIFTAGVLMHIPPNTMVDVIKSCIAKANKYVVHMEPIGEDIVTLGPKNLKPLKVCPRLRCLHNIPRIYTELGMESKLDIKWYPDEVEPFIVVNLEC